MAPLMLYRDASLQALMCFFLMLIHEQCHRLSKLYVCVCAHMYGEGQFDVSSIIVRTRCLVVTPSKGCLKV